MSVSLPSEETTLSLSVTLTTPVQSVLLPVELHERLPLAVTVGVPVESATSMVTRSP